MSQVTSWKGLNIFSNLLKIEYAVSCPDICVCSLFFLLLVMSSKQSVRARKPPVIDQSLAPRSLAQHTEQRKELLRLCDCLCLIRFCIFSTPSFNFGLIYIYIYSSTELRHLVFTRLKHYFKRYIDLHKP